MTIIAMVCSVSVSATGIVAILLDFPIAVANVATIEASSVQGDLYGERYGANNEELTRQHLFKNSQGVDTDAMDYFCRDVSFSTGSEKMEYVFKFILAEGATSATFVSLKNATITNELCYTQTYKVAYGQERPDWLAAENMQVGKTYVCDESRPYIWLYASLSINAGAYDRLVTTASWGFQFFFEGVESQENAV